MSEQTTQTLQAAIEARARAKFDANTEAIWEALKKVSGSQYGFSFPKIDGNRIARVYSHEGKLIEQEVDTSTLLKWLDGVMWLKFGPEYIKRETDEFLSLVEKLEQYSVDQNHGGEQ